MKKLFLIPVFILSLTSCKKEDIKPIVCCNTNCDMKGVENVSVEIHLVDYDTTVYTNELGNVSINNLNDTHFTGDLYALTKSEGVILDSLVLGDNVSNNHFENIYISAPSYEYNFLTTIPCNISSDSIKINKFKRTTLEIYCSGLLMGSALISEGGIGSPSIDMSVNGTPFVNSLFITRLPLYEHKICVRL